MTLDHLPLEMRQHILKHLAPTDAWHAALSSKSLMEAAANAGFLRNYTKGYPLADHFHAGVPSQSDKSYGRVASTLQACKLAEPRPSKTLKLSESARWGRWYIMHRCVVAEYRGDAFSSLSLMEPDARVHRHALTLGPSDAGLFDAIDCVELGALLLCVARDSSPHVTYSVYSQEYRRSPAVSHRYAHLANPGDFAEVNLGEAQYRDPVYLRRTAAGDVEVHAGANLDQAVAAAQRS